MSIGTSNLAYDLEQLAYRCKSRQDYIPNSNDFYEPLLRYGESVDLHIADVVAKLNNQILTLCGRITKLEQIIEKLDGEIK